ncbi:MAG: hypothetical protein IKX20_11875 [Paludibacteraceae bacterium]|nr:hypothetical protein [Paludibacteraceae bacterium]
MSTAKLMDLRNYLHSTLSLEDIVWLVEELKKYVREDSKPKPYTIEELHARIAQSERDFEEGRFYTDAEVFSDLNN